MHKSVSKGVYDKIEYARTIASKYPDESFKICNDLYIFSKSNDSIIEQGYALLGMSLASRSKSDIGSMLDYSYKALHIFKNDDYILGQARSLNLIGIAYFYNSMYEEALDSFLEIIILLENVREDSLKCKVFNNIGEIYREYKMYDLALEYYNKATELAEKNKWEIYIAALLSNVGEVHFVKNDLDKALEVYYKSYFILVNSNDMVSLGEVENRLGMVYYALKNITKAEKYYLDALNRLENIDNKYYIIEVLINLAELYTEKSSDRALDLYEKAMEFAKDIRSKKKISHIYKLLSNYYELQGDYKSALDSYKSFFSFNEEVISSHLGNKLEIFNIELNNFQNNGQYDRFKFRLEMEIKRQKEELEKISVENIILEKKAYEDELTGANNRRSINMYLKDLLHNMYSSRDNIIVFLIDIDKFKRYNDYWGHSGGDLCIKKISDCINNIDDKNNHIFGRYGGEEFIYISTCMNYTQADILGNLIRTRVEDLGLYYIYKGEKLPVTISVGGTIGKSWNYTSMAELMELTDKELYRAKDMGRNKTILKQIE